MSDQEHHYYAGVLNGSDAYRAAKKALDLATLALGKAESKLYESCSHAIVAEYAVYAKPPVARMYMCLVCGITCDPTTTAKIKPEILLYCSNRDIAYSYFQSDVVYNALSEFYSRDNRNAGSISYLRAMARGSAIAAGKEKEVLENND